VVCEITCAAKRRGVEGADPAGESKGTENAGLYLFFQPARSSQVLDAVHELRCTADANNEDLTAKW
jgi:hypothetical protein